MTDVHMINFDDFCDVLIPLGALNSPSELHGLLCGKLCGGAVLTSDQWLSSAWELLDIVGEPNVEIQEPVIAMYTITQAQLSSGDYDLQPFLPDDDSEMEQRTQALSQWCHGFLTGFGSAGIAADTEFTSDQADSLRDIASIVQVTVDEEEDRDEDEQESDYTDLVEHTRIIAMNFYEDNLQEIQDKEKSVKSHKGDESLPKVVH
jgi:yecA family protein